MDASLTDVSRVAHYHPLRPEEPLEVLTLDLCTSHAPTRVREALENLALLHSSGPRDVFHDAMTALSPWRNSYLYAKGLSRDAFPLIAIEVASSPAVAAAEAFFSARKTDSLPAHRLGLFLRVTMDDEATDDEYDTLSRVSAILERLNSDHSRFELKAVEIGFDTDRMGDRDLEMASRVLSLALHEIKPTPAFKVDIGMVGTSAPRQASLEVWGKLFQTMCRVGADRDDSAKGGNKLGVSFAERADRRVVAAFWSSLAFSSGISHLILRSPDEPLESVQAKYMALALLSPISQVKHLQWFNSILRPTDVDAMLQVQAASSLVELSSELWVSDWPSWSQFRGTTMNESIIRRFGWVLHDSGNGDSIDVFVPGLGQCSVTREGWTQGTNSHLPLLPSGLFRASSLTRFESAVQLQEPTTHIQVGRFLSLLGASLQFITLRSGKDRCPLDAVLTIFASCPQLRELTVDELQLASRVIEVDPARLVSTHLVKLKLQFVNAPTPPTPPPGEFTETFFAAVIPVVGHHIEYLELRKQSGIIPFARAFEAIGQSCTSLYHLKLELLDVGALDPLIKAYRDGTSRVSSLYLQKCPVESASLVRFAEFLSDRSCAGSTKLGVLHITHFADNLADMGQLRGLDVVSIKAILAMLKHNQSLTELYLGVADTDVGQLELEPLRPFKRRFDVYDEQEIPVASESYPVESTVAFVDVLQRKRLPYAQEPIRIITAFAAQRIRRSVRYDVVNGYL